MRAELQSILDGIKYVPPEELPNLLGELEVVRATAVMRLSAPAPAQRSDSLIPIKQAAERLGVSVDYLYRNSDSLPFTRRAGRKLLFSSAGIDAYIARKRS